MGDGMRLLRLAFEQDSSNAAFFLGQALLNAGDSDGATKMLSAAAKGHPRACFSIAEFYREGRYQFPVDTRQALHYTKWAAHQGDPQAMSNLGHVLINGMGVIRDEAKAVRLFHAAAKLGAAEGQLNWGLALLRGNGGVTVDYQDALEWAQKSAAQGHSLAHQQLPMFFNAAKNPNPPKRSLPRNRDELAALGVRDLRDFLRSEGIDFSDCVEKADLVARAAQRLPGTEEPWDPAPENPIMLEAPSQAREDLLRARQQRDSQKQQPASRKQSHDFDEAVEVVPAAVSSPASISSAAQDRPLESVDSDAAIAAAAAAWSPDTAKAKLAPAADGLTQTAQAPRRPPAEFEFCD